MAMTVSIGKYVFSVHGIIVFCNKLLILHLFYCSWFMMNQTCNAMMSCVDIEIFVKFWLTPVDDIYYFLFVNSNKAILTYDVLCLVLL